MNNDEVKFRLRAFRPDGSDARDPFFAESLQQVARDPALRGWHERELAFDKAIATKLAHVEPPPELRDALLIGARASRERKPWWRTPVWLGAAAALVAIAGVMAYVLRERGLPPSDLARFALADLAHAHAEHTLPLALAATQAEFAQATPPLAHRLKVDLAALRDKGCRTVRLAGHDVFEICFQREGVWFHLYVTDRPSRGAKVTEPVLRREGALAVASWADPERVYALVTDAGTDALRRLF